MRKYWLAILQGALSVFLIWNIFGNSSLRSEAAGVLTAADPKWLLAGCAAALVTESLSAVRWWFVLRAFGTPVALWRVFAFCGAGIFFSLGLPGTGGGDAFRILYMIRLYPHKKLRASLSVLADRLCGLAALVIAVALSLATRHGLFAVDPLAQKILWGASAMLASTMVLIFLWWLTTVPRIHALWKPGMLPPLRKRVHHLGAVFVGLAARPRLILAATAASLVALTSHFTTYFSSARAFALPVSLLDLFTVMPAIDTLIVLPVTLFGIGLRETLFQQLLGSMYGIPGGAAAMASLGGFGMQAAVALLGGLFTPFTTPPARFGRRSDPSG